MALKGANGHLEHHTLSGLHVCCERALKSAGKRNTHGGGGGTGAFGLRETARRTRGFESRRSGIQRRFGGGGAHAPQLAKY
jgi:hypothetical protein